MSRKPSREIDLGKASLYAVIVNVSEIVVLLGFVMYVLMTEITQDNITPFRGWRFSAA